MTRLLVQPIVEGHGEEHCARILIQRLVIEGIGADHVEVLHPIRRPRSKLVQADAQEVERAVRLAAQKLAHAEFDVDRRVILLLIDADTDCPRELAPRLLRRAQQERADVSILCVLANVEYETWFVAAAESLTEFLDCSQQQSPNDPEVQRSGKAWVQRAFRGARYSETVDQPRMTAAMDLRLCRDRSPSFDKLWRDFERCVTEAAD